MKFIEIISVPVTDQAVAKEFYLKLGFEVLAEAPFGKDGHWVQLGYPGQRVSVTLTTWFPELKPGSLIGFVIKVENMDAAIEELNGKGIEVGKIDSTPWGKFAQVKDPDGNTWSLHE